VTEQRVEWTDTEIDGVIIRTLTPHRDERGTLTELFRRDDLQEALARGFSSMMGYMSVTEPGVMRGPHEHRQQTDVFVFQGRFDLYLWRLGQMRVGEPPHNARYRVTTIPEVLCRVIVPPGVVHGYKNQGEQPGIVFNFPDQLYGGWGRGTPVDEIRHESDPETIYVPW
jgi:dTDP-4-dehydrorhamnose 3,5-epimerase